MISASLGTSLLDHIYSNDATTTSNIESYKPLIGDHSLVMFNLKVDASGILREGVNIDHDLLVITPSVKFPNGHYFHERYLKKLNNNPLMTTFIS